MLGCSFLAKPKANHQFWGALLALLAFLFWVSEGFSPFKHKLVTKGQRFKFVQPQKETLCPETCVFFVQGPLLFGGGVRIRKNKRNVNAPPTPVPSEPHPFLRLRILKKCALLSESGPASPIFVGGPTGSARNKEEQPPKPRKSKGLSYGGRLNTGWLFLRCLFTGCLNGR